MMRAAISAPTPHCCQPSSTVTRRAGLLDRRNDGVGVHRLERAQVNHLGIDAFAGQFFGGLEGIVHAHRPGDDRHVVSGPRDLCLADRQDKVIELRHRRRVAVENFVFEEDHRIGIADRGLQQALGIGSVGRRNHLQAWNVRVPRRIILAVLGGDACGDSIRPAEHNLATHLSARHVQGLRGGIDQLVNRLHGEVECHEFDDGLQTCECRADAKAGKSVLGDRRVDDAFGAEFLQQALRDLVRTLIFGDLLAHHEDVFVASHFLGHRVAQRFAHGHRDHLGAFGNVGIARDLRRWRIREPLLALAPAHRASSGFLSFRRRRVPPLSAARRFGRLYRGLVLALAENDRNGRVDRDIGGALRNQDFPERAFIGRLDFHRRLVGFDFGNDVARFDLVAFLLEPLGEIALLHRRRQRGHEDFGRHGALLLSGQQI